MENISNNNIACYCCYLLLMLTYFISFSSCSDLCTILLRFDDTTIHTQKQMAVFDRIRLEASKEDYPALLANGNLVEDGDAEEEGRHFATWPDPYQIGRAHA